MFSSPYPCGSVNSIVLVISVDPALNPSFALVRKVLVILVFSVVFVSASRVANCSLGKKQFSKYLNILGGL